MTNATTATDSRIESLIDLSAIGVLVRRHKWPMLAAAVAVLLLTVIAYMLTGPLYQAETLLALDRADQTIVTAPDDKRPNEQVLTDSSQVDTEVQILQSSVIAEAAVRAQKLNTNPAFLQSLSNSPQVKSLSVEAAAAMISSNLSVRREGTSYAIQVAYNSSDPEVAAMVANAIASAYVGGQVESKVAGRSHDIAMLRTRLDQLRSDVMTAESAVSSYRAQTGLVGASDTSVIPQQQLSTLTTALAQARADLAGAGAQARANSGTSGSLVNSSAIVSNLRIEQARLAGQQAEMAKRYGALYPDREQLDAQLAAVNSALARETSRISAGVGADVQAARDRVGAIQGAIGQTRGELALANSASGRLNELERVAESARQLYQAFLDRYRVELATQGTERGRAYVIASATAPSFPTSPNIAAFLLAGLAVALLAAGVVAVLFEWLERGVRTRAEAETKLGLPVLASIPDLSTVRNADFSGGTASDIANYLVANDGSVFNESFRSIRTALKVGQSGQIAKVVMITSAMPDEGKTTTSICLARSSAMAGHKTLLIDADVRRHTSTRMLTSSPRAGLIDVLQGKAKLEDALLLDKASGAFILPQVPGTVPAYDIVQSVEMAALLKTMSEQFDLIVLDTAPVLAVAESRAIGAMADASILVVRWRKTRVANARAAIDQLNRAGARVTGVIMTQIDVRAAAILSEDMVHYQSYAALAAS
ncbi:MAG: polysaccharide biosynthesis tyrosine autokinase [bacterium]|nr:polysaccharide biosynthesis tyrosine autokinase [bacterium]